ncbi:MAG: DUF2288 family protein [Polyangiaceae bacterium]
MSEPMTMAEAVRYQLERRRGAVFYSDLAAHIARDAVFVVRADLDLVDCGVAVAQDSVEIVRGWIEGGKLRKPSVAERASWPLETGRRWLAIVVQPFVLVQDAADDLAGSQPTSFD